MNMIIALYKSLNYYYYYYLLHNLDVWRKITSDPWALETVSGYHLEFDTLPVQSVLPRPPPFSEGEKQLIDEEITKLLTKGSVRKVSVPVPMNLFQIFFWYLRRLVICVQ